MHDSERERDLLLYHYGELDPGSAKRFSEHLAACADCRAALAVLKAAAKKVRELSPEPPAELLRRVRESARRTIPSEETHGFAEFFRLSWPRLALAGAAAAGMLLMVLQGRPTKIATFSWQDGTEERITALRSDLDKFEWGEWNDNGELGAFEWERLGLESNREMLEQSLKGRSL